MSTTSHLLCSCVAPSSEIGLTTAHLHDHSFLLTLLRQGNVQCLSSHDGTLIKSWSLPSSQSFTSSVHSLLDQDQNIYYYALTQNSTELCVWKQQTDSLLKAWKRNVAQVTQSITNKKSNKQKHQASNTAASITSISSAIQSIHPLTHTQVLLIHANGSLHVVDIATSHLVDVQILTSALVKEDQDAHIVLAGCQKDKQKVNEYIAWYITLNKKDNSYQLHLFHILSKATITNSSNTNVPSTPLVSSQNSASTNSSSSSSSTTSTASSIHDSDADITIIGSHVIQHPTASSSSSLKSSSSTSSNESISLHSACVSLASRTLCLLWSDHTLSGHSFLPASITPSLFSALSVALSCKFIRQSSLFQQGKLSLSVAHDDIIFTNHIHDMTIIAVFESTYGTLKHAIKIDKNNQSTVLTWNEFTQLQVASEQTEEEQKEKKKKKQKTVTTTTSTHHVHITPIDASLNSVIVNLPGSLFSLSLSTSTASLPTHQMSTLAGVLGKLATNTPTFVDGKNTVTTSSNNHTSSSKSPASPLLTSQGGVVPLRCSAADALHLLPVAQLTQESEEQETSKNKKSKKSKKGSKEDDSSSSAKSQEEQEKLLSSASYQLPSQNEAAKLRAYEILIQLLPVDVAQTPKASQFYKLLKEYIDLCHQGTSANNEEEGKVQSTTATTIVAPASRKRTRSVFSQAASFAPAAIRALAARVLDILATSPIPSEESFAKKEKLDNIDEEKADTYWKSLSVLLLSDSLSARALPKLISTLLTYHKVELLESALVHVHDIMEQQLVDILSYVLSYIPTPPTRNQVVLAPPITAQEKGKHGKKNAMLASQRTHTVIHNVPDVPTGPFAVLLDLIVTSPYSSNFLRSALTSLSLRSSHLFLSCLFGWLVRYWLHGEFEVSQAGRSLKHRIPSFNQVVEWSSLVLDAQFETFMNLHETIDNDQTVSKDRAATLLKSFQALLTSAHLPLLERMESIKGFINIFNTTLQLKQQNKNLKNALPQANVVDYSIEVMELPM